MAEGPFILRDHPRALVELIHSRLGRYYDVDSVELFKDMRQMLDTFDDRIPSVAFNTAQYPFISYLLHAGIIRLVMFFVDYPKDMLASIYTFNGHK